MKNQNGPWTSTAILEYRKRVITSKLFKPRILYIA